MSEALIHRFRIRALVAFALSLAFHAAWFASWTFKVPVTLTHDLQIDIVEMPTKLKPVDAARVEQPAVDSSGRPNLARPEPNLPEPPNKPDGETAPALESSSRQPPSEKPPASLAAPPAPSAEEWQLASTYTPRNSKRYRHAWGQQVRSMMGTAVEGPDQGMVRFRIEIAPDGRVAKVDELWSTSEKASRLALQAIRSLPPLPPTPTGKPIVFEQTISFMPYETGWPPSYKLDCLPEPEPFESPFTWDGKSPQNVVERKHRPPPPEGCIPDSTAETIEEEEQSFKRQMDQWRWAR